MHKVVKGPTSNDCPQPLYCPPPPLLSLPCLRVPVCTLTPPLLQGSCSHFNSEADATWSPSDLNRARVLWHLALSSLSGHHQDGVEAFQTDDLLFLMTRCATRPIGKLPDIPRGLIVMADAARTSRTSPTHQGQGARAAVSYQDDCKR